MHLRESKKHKQVGINALDGDFFTAGGLKLVLADDKYIKSSYLEAFTQHVLVVRFC